MVDPVNLNIPGFPYLLFALVFFIVVALLAAALVPLELAIRRQRDQRSNRTEKSIHTLTSTENTPLWK